MHENDTEEHSNTTTLIRENDRSSFYERHADGYEQIEIDEIFENDGSE